MIVLQYYCMLPTFKYQCYWKNDDNKWTTNKDFIFESVSYIDKVDFVEWYTATVEESDFFVPRRC